MAEAGSRRGGSSRRALELELVDLALAAVLATRLEGQHLQVAGQVLELGQ
jgi:hypothetical protein